MKSEKGQSLVEFALILPVLIFLLFGIVDFGRYFHAYLTVDHAGREAARAASIGKPDIEQIAVGKATSIGLTTGMVLVIPKAPKPDEVTITITYPFSFITPVLGTLLTSIDIVDTTIMRIE